MRKLLFLLLLLVACEMIPTQLPFGKQGAKPLPEILIGTSALQASFNSNSMSNILMCQQANVLVDLRNAGASNITNAAFILISEEQYLKPLGKKNGVLSLEGKSLFNPPGGYAQLEFKLENKGLPPQLESYSSSLIFQACYKYRTVANAQICIDPDISNLKKNKVCSAQPVSFSGGQGAPVAVVRVEPMMIPEGDKVKPMVTIYVQHVGDGTVVSQENAELACSGKKVRLSGNLTVRAEMSGVELSCPDFVRLEPEGESRIVCSSSALSASAGTFTTVLIVELDYGYVSTAVLPISITTIANQKPC